MKAVVTLGALCALGLFACASEETTAPGLDVSAVDAEAIPDAPEADAEEDVVRDVVEPMATASCRPCVEDADCGANAFCRAQDETGTSHCIISCDQGAAACPQATECTEQNGGNWCVPEAACECAPEHAGYVGACTSDGGCAGTYACLVGLPIACDAPAPVTEWCNGFDDDCDGQVDEDVDGTCDDGSPCTTEACVDGQCIYEATAEHCLIGANCFEAGDAQPGNACAQCVPDASTTEWTALAGGTPCNDGQVCTFGDACQDGQCVAGGAMDCDDGASCTQDSCDPVLGCVNAPLDDVACDDADACTTGDICQEGACIGAPMKCDDGLDCTVDTCAAGTCSSDEVVADWCVVDQSCFAAGTQGPGGPCFVCDPEQDSKDWTVRPNGAGCDDGDACTTGDSCLVGLCAAEILECDDGNACTLDVCVSLVGCLHQGVSGLFCDDDDPCTEVDSCVGEFCVGSGDVSCEDDNDCTIDLCVPGTGCTFPPDGGSTCDDGDACTEGDACSGVECAGTPLDCDDNVSCTLDSCSAGACVHTVVETACQIDGACVPDGELRPGNPCEVCDAEAAPNVWSPRPPGVPCDDGDACTSGEQCQSGACVGGSAVVCDDQNACTADSCDSSAGCVTTPVGGTCNDGLACTVSDACADGACSGQPRDCSGQDAPCVLGVCDEAAGGCVASAMADGTACDDGKPCSGPDACQAGACEGASIAGCCTSAAECDDQNACTVDTCGEGGVCSSDVTPLDGQACDDGRFCTVDDACSAGQCLGVARQCDDDECNDGVCDEVASACAKAPLADGTPCSDDGNPCTDDRCTVGLCVHAANAAPCDDGVDCTFNDGCGGGECAGTAYDCDDGLACTEDVCLGDGTCSNGIDEGACIAQGACHEDGDADPLNPCRRCDSAVNPMGWTTSADGVACSDDADPCTDDVCGGGSCTHPFNEAPCDDGQPCTRDDLCAQGQCDGVDYDCDDGIPCTLDSCDGQGGCTHPVADGFCLIAGTCYANGMGSPAAPCLVCDAAAESTTWTARPNGQVCDDGSACTTDDACQAGACVGAAKSCDDANLCTDDSCAPQSGCVNTPNTKQCSDNLFCTVDDRCSEGACVGGARDCTGVADQCNDGMCDEAAAACVPDPIEDGTPCSDGAICTGPDACAAGQCNGPLLAGCCTADSDCNDSNPCTQDTCDAAQGACSHNPKPLEGQPCQDGAFCTVADTCSDGDCVGGPRDCSLLDDECSVGECDEDANACVGAATNEAQPCSDDGKVCTDDVCQGGACSHPNNTAPCDDGEVCSFADTCNSGVCGGTGYDCDDGLACTKDSCDGVGGCLGQTDEGFCVIDAACVAAGASKPGDVCQVCDPSVDAAGWSPAAEATPCDDGDSCTVGDACGGGVCASGVNQCGPCDGKAQGEGCDDEEAETHGDICLDGQCAGFRRYSPQVNEGSESPYLHEVTWTLNGFVATGGDDKKDRGWLATIAPNGAVSRLGSTNRNDEKYTQITDRMAITDGGTVMVQTEFGWSPDPDFSTTLDGATGGGEYLTTWGRRQGNNYVYWIAGRDSETWIARCGAVPDADFGLSCTKQSASLGDFVNEVPAAMGGFGGEANPNQIRVYLTADFEFGTGFANDVLRETGVTSSNWSTDFFDNSPSPSRGRDLNGTATTNAWMVGTEGLLRCRHQQQFQTTWVDAQPLGPTQVDFDFNGVWVSPNVVLVAGNRFTEGAVSLSLVTHEVGSGYANSDAWNVIELETLDDADCQVGPCDEDSSGGSLTDVWAHDGVVVMVGWVYDADDQATRPLVWIRTQPEP